MDTHVLYVIIVVVLVLFAGLMSGLTLGLMSLNMIDLKVLEINGTEAEKENVKKIMPVVENPHFTLVTLLLWNAIAIEAMPIFLNHLVNETTAIALSVTVVLFFGEIIPQSICCRYGLVIGSRSAQFVLLLRRVSSLISWPVSKLLDYLMGEKQRVYLKRGYLKNVVALSSTMGSAEGELTQDEVQVINGALDMQAKTVNKAMTPIEKVCMVSLDRTINKEFIEEIVKTGHSRIPVYSGDNKNVIKGVMLVKELLNVDLEAGKTVGDLALRKLASLRPSAPMYDVLPFFKSGRGHMAVIKQPLPSRAFSDPTYSNLALDSGRSMERGPVVGIITLEDVIEELIQTEIVDETDRYTDNTQVERVRVNIMDSNLPPRVKRWIHFITPGPGNLSRGRSRSRASTSRLPSEYQRGDSLPLLTEDSEHV